MRKIALLSLFISFLNCTFGQSVNSRFALLIGVSNYADKNWKQPLSSAKDVELLRKLLIERGFPSSQIMVLENEKATYSGIDQALRQLHGKIVKGASVYFHFSGHGQQIYDSTYPMLDEIDGYDEALVPYDAPARYDDVNLQKEKHFRDDLLFEHYTRIRKKIGPSGSFFVTIDACHSGTSSRGFEEAMSRGVSIPYAPNNYRPVRNANSVNDGFEPLINSDSLSPITCFYACGPTEINKETTIDNGIGIGSLTYGLIRAMNQVSSSNSYLFLFEKLRDEMSSRVPVQTPQYEGSLNVEILKGNLLPLRKYFLIDKIIDKENLVIRSGKLNGINEGSLVSFYPPDADTAGVEPFAQGIVKSASMTHAEVLLNKKQSRLNYALLNASWGYITEEVLPFNLTVDLGLVQHDRLIKNISAFKFITITKDNPHLKAFLNQAKDSIYFKNKYGFVMSPGIRIRDTIRFASQLKELLLTSAKAEFYRAFDQVQGLKIHPEIIFKSLNAEVPDENLLLTSVDNSGNTVFYETKGNKIRVDIDFPEPLKFKLFYAILDVQPDDKINIVTGKIAPENCMIPSGSEGHQFPSPISMAPPYGKEHMVFLFSKKPIYLNESMQTRGSDGMSMQSLMDFFEQEGTNYKSRSVGNGSQLSLLNDLQAEVIKFEVRPERK